MKSSRRRLTAAAWLLLSAAVLMGAAMTHCQKGEPAAAPEAPTPEPGEAAAQTGAPAPEPGAAAPEEGATILSKPADQLTVEEMEKLQAVLETNQGVIKFKFYPRQAPNHCRNFIKLAEKGFYNGLIFHRVIPGFMLQGGDPSGTGSGGPGWTIAAEFSDLPHLKGTVSMARTNDPNSAGSQFFIMLDRKPHLDHQYSVFGQVAQGQEVVDKIGAAPNSGPRGNPPDRPTQDQVMQKVFIEQIR